MRISIRYPVGHYRVPRYIRGKNGTIEIVNGSKFGALSLGRVAPMIDAGEAPFDVGFIDPDKPSYAAHAGRDEMDALVPTVTTQMPRHSFET